MLLIATPHKLWCTSIWPKHFKLSKDWAQTYTVCSSSSAVSPTIGLQQKKKEAIVTLYPSTLVRIFKVKHPYLIFLHCNPNPIPRSFPIRASLPPLYFDAPTWISQCFFLSLPKIRIPKSCKRILTFPFPLCRPTGDLHWTYLPTAWQRHSIIRWRCFTRITELFVRLFGIKLRSCRHAAIN